MIPRSLESHVLSSLENGFVTILYGARQVGKTTLAKHILERSPEGLYLNADDRDVVVRLQNQSLIQLQAAVGSAKTIVIDEAQRIENIGIIAKLIHDQMPEKRLLLTGSSSLDLANSIKEPLTGRAQEFELFPLGLKEVAHTVIEGDGYLARLLVYGGYPGLWGLDEVTVSKRTKAIANQFLFKDAFAFDSVYDQSVMRELLVLLAFQVGSEVSYNELASNLEVSKNTVMRYIDLLEKSFIVFRRNQYRRNQRVQIGRLRKVYFYDLGIRNALIDNFNPLQLRGDVGALWENFCVLERLKRHQREERYVRSYYWRSRDHQEVDIVEEASQQLEAYECKWQKDPRFPGGFLRQFPDVPRTGITRRNYWDFV